jgi:hypothetical protein
MGDVFTGFWLGGLKARDHWKDLGIGRRITLRLTLGRYWIQLAQDRVSFCEHGNEPSGSIRKQDIL